MRTVEASWAAGCTIAPLSGIRFNDRREAVAEQKAQYSIAAGSRTIRSTREQVEELAIARSTTVCSLKTGLFGEGEFVVARFIAVPWLATQPPTGEASLGRQLQPASIMEF